MLFKLIKELFKKDDPKKDIIELPGPPGWKDPIILNNSQKHTVVRPGKFDTFGNPIEKRIDDITF